MELVLELLAALLVGGLLVGLVMGLLARRGRKIVPSFPLAPPDDPPEQHGDHIYPVMDRFDGLWETWICRHCGINHLRRRPGL